ncbi:MAG: dihydrofolate reductase family protein, partial [Gammaproteobacteria bacterium SHHR-1]
NEVWVEAGATLSGALLQAGLVDELILYMAPKLMGDAARGLLHLPGLERMAQCIPLEYADIRRVGRDLRFVIPCVPV